MKKIMIKISGKEIETTIDKNGVQRLPCNKHLDLLIKNKVIDLNDFVFKYIIGKIKRSTYVWLYQNIGYSVDGYASIFPNVKIENPLWEE
jgi:hypothetical protein